ncbi:protachykinin-1 isoform 1-T1 [Aulostomus maculatus]
MKLLLVPVLMLVCAAAQVSCEEPKEEVDYWTSSSQVQDAWLANDPFRQILLRMTRKPRPRQFIGLMGKRSTGKSLPPGLSASPLAAALTRPLLSPPAANAQITRKRHKINSFVGLMGKRSQEDPDSYEWSTLQTYDQRR